MRQGDREVLFRGLNSPDRLTVDAPMRKLYWREAGADALKRGSIDGGVATPLRLVERPSEQPIKRFMIARDGRSVRAVDADGAVTKLLEDDDGIKFVSRGDGDRIYYITNDNTVSCTKISSKPDS